MKQLRIVALAATLLAAATSVSAARPKHHQLDGYTFEAYMKDFNKHYDTEAELQTRRTLFERALAEVQTHNKGPSSWKLGVNHLTDRTEAELRRMRGNKIIAHKAAGLVPEPEAVFSPTGVPTPRTVDWRDAKPSVVSAVKDQGDCGSCWAHSATEAIESQVAIQTGELFVLSQQAITSCTPNPDECGGNGGCGGATYELAWNYTATIGLEQEWTYPYTSYFGKSGTCEAKKKLAVAKVTGYTSIPSNSLSALEEAIATVGPISIGVDASAWPNYEAGIFGGCNFAKNVSIDHAVMAVGYGHDDAYGLDYWVIRNSWNAGWGEGGYMRLLKDTANPQCGWNVDPQNGIGCKGQTEPQWVCGTCAIGFDPAYPNV